ncbi:MAG TPA: D-alanyl-D-alanine carboxypeptidase/D-alanyl-D-alanine-endopeptidase [Bryobacteraceae bacterium]|nr:D-alanyl-D-alanine carboxypeptidase/D-alanyl-D-alanine-endopeptidase [Bryobacteraceae bacterium]
MRELICLVLMLAPALGADRGLKLDQLIANAPAVTHAFVGIQVVRLSDGDVLYAHNADRLFLPASNMKLFTTAMALRRLGADYRLKTQIVADSTVDSAGTLAGDLRLVGGGDPSLSGRDYPYRNHAPSSAVYSFRAIDELADQVVRKGVRRIDGDIVGDDTRYIWEPHAGGWSSGNAVWEYGAPVSALILDDNSFAVTVRPASRTGDLAVIQVKPSLEYFAIDNRVVTTEGGERKIEFDRNAAGRELHIWGTLPKSDVGVTEELAVADPALYAAQALRDALVRRGIAIHGDAVARHRYSDDSYSDDSAAAANESNPPVVLAERSSPRLLELLQVTDKVSQNLHAEVFLRETAVAAGRRGSREAGLKEMADFLDGLGISKYSYQFTDGAGLSRSTLVSPAAIVQLLTAMYNSDERQRWLDLLPVGGLDGTLGTRFGGRAAARGIRAKTGTLDHVRALSGYAESATYGPLAFSFLINNFEEPGSAVTRLLDELALALLR